MGNPQQKKALTARLNLSMTSWGLGFWGFLYVKSDVDASCQSNYVNALLSTKYGEKI